MNSSKRQRTDCASLLKPENRRNRHELHRPVSLPLSLDGASTNRKSNNHNVIQIVFAFPITYVNIYAPKDQYIKDNLIREPAAGIK